MQTAAKRPTLGLALTCGGDGGVDHTSVDVEEFFDAYSSPPPHCRPHLTSPKVSSRPAIEQDSQQETTVAVTRGVRGSDDVLGLHRAWALGASSLDVDKVG
jgi:hypothetical protein